MLEKVGYYEVPLVVFACNLFSCKITSHVFQCYGNKLIIIPYNLYFIMFLEFVCCEIYTVTLEQEIY